MTEAAVSFAGNLTDHPELRHTGGGIVRAMFRVAVSGRREQEASFFTAVVWGDQAEHAAQSRSKGSGATPHSRAKAASLPSRPGLSPAVTSTARRCPGQCRAGPTALARLC
jgi:hypothetical protein